MPRGPSWPTSRRRRRLLAVGGGILAIGGLAFGLGRWVASRVAQFGYATNPVWRRYTRGARLLTVAGLAIYALIIHVLGWSRLVLSTAGLQGLVLVDDLAVLSALYPDPAPHLGRSLPRRAGTPHYADLPVPSRLPVPQDTPIRGADLARRLDLRPASGCLRPVLARLASETRSPSPLELAGLALLILLCSPLFVRLAWPTRSLPDGPLRQRLERVARRVGFRFTDLLVWDTGHIMVNACVTGVLPRFRYVLLTDELIESLSPVEIAAVFGHEIGHVAHRHLPFFGFFFLGSLGVMAMTAQFFSISEGWIAGLPWVPASQLAWVTDVVETAAILGSLAVFMWLVFGHLSRRFERQADVFGCKVVSCGVPDCPPTSTSRTARSRWHRPAAARRPLPGRHRDLLPCPRQRRPPERHRRHGPILEAWVDRQPARVPRTTPGQSRRREPAFQRGVRSFRFALSAFLVTSLVLAVMTRSWELLH